ncbi:hypothetical protein [Nocardioides sp.]|uniref:hypothetical protein n=1 Tax=Nocardioides sp. TaxID=35761 RepID=UPI002ED35514
MRWLYLLLLALLPLQWFVVGAGLRLHMAAIVLFTAVVFATHGTHLVARVIRMAEPFIAANLALTVIWVFANRYHGFGVRQPAEQMVLLAGFVAVAVATLAILRDPGGRGVELLRWSTWVCMVSLVGAMTYSMTVNGVNAVEVFGRTLTSGDPQVLQRELFRSAFGGFGLSEEAVMGNIRHEVFGALLLALCLSSACRQLRPFATRRLTAVYLLGQGLAVMLLLLSMSRSVIIALAAWPMLGLLRQLLAGRVTARGAGAGVLIVGAAGVLATVGVLQVLWVRFTQDTGSYEARDNLLQAAYSNLGRSLATGGVSTASASSHNFVIDTWLRAGIVASLAALVVVVLVCGLFIALAFTLPQEPPWMLPVTAMLVLPVVRFFTAGGGLIPPVQWIALGVVAGFLCYRAELRATAASVRAPDTVPTAVRTA